MSYSTRITIHLVTGDTTKCGGVSSGSLVTDYILRMSSKKKTSTQNSTKLSMEITIDEGSTVVRTSTQDFHQHVVPVMLSISMIHVFRTYRTCHVRASQVQC